MIKITFDYDGCLSQPKIQELAKKCISLGCQVYILTSRFDCIRRLKFNDKNLLKRLFGKRQPPLQQCSVSGSCNQYDAYEQLITEKVIELLKTKPERFSARWFNGKTLDKSVRIQSTGILIMIDSGQIFQPVKPRMTKEQKELVKQLLEPIVKKDSDYLIKRLVCNCH